MTHAWALCDAPGTLYALLKCGVRDARIDRAVKKLAALVEPKGCGCVVSEELGNWRGPGKASDPCPYATLVVMKLLIEASMRIGIDFRSQIEACGSCLLDLWEQSREKHTYIFYMGNDFRKLKLPFVWYDILHVTDVISRPGIFSGDPRLREMVGVISEKRTDSGYVPESVYLPWKDWDFGQKKLVSDWMTFCALRVESRLITSSWY